jgi:hypothetical protein
VCVWLSVRAKATAKATGRNGRHLAPFPHVLLVVQYPDKHPAAHQALMSGTVQGLISWVSSTAFKTDLSCIKTQCIGCRPLTALRG